MKRLQGIQHTGRSIGFGYRGNIRYPLSYQHDNPVFQRHTKVIQKFLQIFPFRAVIFGRHVIAVNHADIVYISFGRNVKNTVCLIFFQKFPAALVKFSL